MFNGRIWLPPEKANIARRPLRSSFTSVGSWGDQRSTKRYPPETPNETICDMWNLMMICSDMSFISINLNQIGLSFVWRPFFFCLDVHFTHLRGFGRAPPACHIGPWNPLGRNRGARSHRACGPWTKWGPSGSPKLPVFPNQKLVVYVSWLVETCPI